MTGELDDNGEDAPAIPAASEGAEPAPAGETGPLDASESGHAGAGVGGSGGGAPPDAQDTGSGPLAEQEAGSGTPAEQQAGQEPAVDGGASVEEGAGADAETAGQSADTAAVGQGEPGEDGPVDAGIEEPGGTADAYRAGALAEPAADTNPPEAGEGEPAGPIDADPADGGTAESGAPAESAQKSGEAEPTESRQTADAADTADLGGETADARQAEDAAQGGEAGEAGPADAQPPADAHSDAAPIPAASGRSSDSSAQSSGGPSDTALGADQALVGAEQGPPSDQPPQDRVAVHVDGEPGESKLMSTLENPEVKSAVDSTWNDSQAENYDSRHEEGGWLIRNDVTGKSRLERVPAGVRAGIQPGSQPGLGSGEHIQGFVHTHPNPTVDERGNQWRPEPSDTDKGWSERKQIPIVARTATALYVYFPRSAR
jgi:hypothetical protein